MEIAKYWALPEATIINGDDGAYVLVLHESLEGGHIFKKTMVGKEAGSDGFLP